MVGLLAKVDSHVGTESTSLFGTTVSLDPRKYTGHPSNSMTLTKGRQRHKYRTPNPRPSDGLPSLWPAREIVVEKTKNASKPSNQTSKRFFPPTIGDCVDCPHRISIQLLAVACPLLRETESPNKVGFELGLGGE